MNNGYSRSQQRREAARKYAVQCMNARGEIECSECGGAVEEARGNRNAQELKREGIRKSTDPICNACQASWRYSHHQEPEMANATDDYKVGDRIDVHGEVGVITKVKGNGAYMVNFHYGTVEVGEKDIDGISSHFENGTNDHLKGLKYPIYYCVTCDEGINKDSAGHEGHNIEKIEKPGNRENADSEKCSRCGTKVGATGVEHGDDVYCVDCAVEKGYIDKKDVP